MPIILEEDFSAGTISALDMITAAARKLGAIGIGEALGADEAAAGLYTLNSMLDSWSADKLLIYHIQQETLTWPSDTASRTIGDGGNFDTTRPMSVLPGTFFRDSGSNDFPVEVTHERAEYDKIGDKTSEGSYPNLLFYDRNYPLGRIYVWPVPSTSLSLLLNSMKQLQRFNSLASGLSLPPGYQWAIENNLAVALEPDFGLPCPPSVVDEARKSKHRIKDINIIPKIASLAEPVAVLGGRGRGDIFAGE